MKANILGHFWLALVVDKGEGVMPGIPSVKESPPFTRVRGVIELVAQWWVNSYRGWGARLLRPIEP